jgi:hypothetical protein
MKGLKKRYSREEYVKRFLMSNNMCDCCYNNAANYLVDKNNSMDTSRLQYFKSLCKECKYNESTKFRKIIFSKFEPLFD